VIWSAMMTNSSLRLRSDTNTFFSGKIRLLHNKRHPLKGL